MKDLGKLKKDFGIGPMFVPCQCSCYCSTWCLGGKPQYEGSENNDSSKDSSTDQSLYE